MNRYIWKQSLFMVDLLKVDMYFVGTVGLSVSFVERPESRTSTVIWTISFHEI
jgi:hypothetical protein